MLIIRIFIIFVQIYATYFCSGKKVTLEKTQFNCTVKFEGQLADFYLEGEFVKQWVLDNYETKKQHIGKEVYGAQPVRNDNSTYLKLSKIKTGDTLIISELEHRRLTEIIQLNLKDLFLQNTIVKMQVYDKNRKEFVDQIHCMVSKATTSNGATGKKLTLYNAKYKHSEPDSFFIAFYDFKGGF